jgi:hypothetical protein
MFFVIYLAKVKTRKNNPLIIVEFQRKRFVNIFGVRSTFECTRARTKILDVKILLTNYVYLVYAPKKCSTASVKLLYFKLFGFFMKTKTRSRTKYNVFFIH